ncbi:MAG TPA: hypothetical protein VEJ63_18370 [Planctomycetota bacterium]|nr:hypothetical protein [Planctomycetota bacterium]
MPEVYRSQVEQRGYTILEAAYSSAECRHIRDIFESAWRRAECRSRGGRFGFVMHPLLRYAPEMAPFYARRDVISVLREVLGDEVRLAHSGGLFSDESRQFTEWHYHRTDMGSDKVWDLKRTEPPARVERVLANVYVDGSNPDVGELLLYPRRISDPLAPPTLARTGDWPNQIVVTCPPGSIVIFDQHVFHAARPSRGACARRIFGGHYQGWSNPAPHREDNASDHEGLEVYKVDPVLRGLLQQPVAAR